jgi:hypothetical protein
LKEAMETLWKTKQIILKCKKYMNDDMMHSRISIMKIWDVTFTIGYSFLL